MWRRESWHESGKEERMSNEPGRRTFRIGIDVGGTFTKAVLIDNRDHSVVGRYSVLTTHDDPRGVAKGVVEVFRNVLEGSAVDPIDVVFLAHSTTQATNALLEGDVATVGIIGMSSRLESLLAKGQTAIGQIELAPGRFLTPQHRFLFTESLTEENVGTAVAELAAAGAKVIVASNAFGVDDNTQELLVMKGAHDAGLSSTGGHEITKLYGLTTRTRTAVINASILPKMIDTANMTEASVREAGIQAPMMIMRGDGGVMGIQEMRRRPAVTMLSGPAASVAGALMHLKVSDGIYFEVGGTSTNIGVIRNGRPTIKYARVGGHETYVNSLDVRVVGIAGGSMVRVVGNAIHDVGPRSAHIAGLGYACLHRSGSDRRSRVRDFPAQARRSRRLCGDPLRQRHPRGHHQLLCRKPAGLRQARHALLGQPRNRCAAPSRRSPAISIARPRMSPARSWSVPRARSFPWSRA